VLYAARYAPALLSPMAMALAKFLCLFVRRLTGDCAPSMTLSMLTPSRPLDICCRVSRLGNFAVGIFAVLILLVYTVLL